MVRLLGPVSNVVWLTLLNLYIFLIQHVQPVFGARHLGHLQILEF